MHVYFLTRGRWSKRLGKRCSLRCNTRRRSRFWITASCKRKSFKKFFVICFIGCFEKVDATIENRRPFVVASCRRIIRHSTFGAHRQTTRWKFARNEVDTRSLRVPGIGREPVDRRVIYIYNFYNNC